MCPSYSSGNQQLTFSAESQHRSTSAKVAKYTSSGHGTIPLHLIAGIDAKSPTLPQLSLPSPRHGRQRRVIFPCLQAASKDEGPKSTSISMGNAPHLRIIQNIKRPSSTVNRSNVSISCKGPTTTTATAADTKEPIASSLRQRSEASLHSAAGSSQRRSVSFDPRVWVIEYQRPSEDLRTVLWYTTEETTQFRRDASMRQRLLRSKRAAAVLKATMKTTTPNHHGGASANDRVAAALSEMYSPPRSVRSDETLTTTLPRTNSTYSLNHYFTLDRGDKLDNERSATVIPCDIPPPAIMIMSAAA